MHASSSSTNFASAAAAVLGGPVITEPATLISGQNLAALVVVGRITASGKLTKAVETAENGSEVPVGILAYAVDASGGDKACQFYKGGRFNRSLVTIDASYTAAQIAAMFDRTAISLETPTTSAEAGT